MNLGQWKSSKPGDHVQLEFSNACEAAVRSVLEAVRLEQGETIIDVGFGCGDQDLYILQNYNVARIIGYNASEDQVNMAKERAKRLDENRFEPLFGIAPFLPIEDESTDVVLSIDSAYHYDSREEFIRRSSRWLRRGGRFGALDLTLNKRPLSTFEWTLVRIFAKLTGFPLCNLYDAETYMEIMRREGYTNVSSTTIDETGFSDLAKFIQAHLERYEHILSSSILGKYRMTAKIMEFLGKRALFRLSVFTGTKPLAD
jgi:microcystin synthetase protein McyJ